MVGANFPGSKILEVGCGTGVGSLSYASVFLNENSILVSSDFSEEMVKRLSARYEASGFTKV